MSAPLLIGVDDLQWADASSLLTLGVLSRAYSISPSASSCASGRRRAPDLDRLAAALESGGAQHLVLGGLAERA